MLIKSGIDAIFLRLFNFSFIAYEEGLEQSSPKG